MENVVAFNNELTGLYSASPPISKAKMAAITRGAMKAIKFYKHVVQSVEKFILKCKPEYKIPGLYVIDSIVRQSRHQYGPEKDVFAPRFARNIKQTFANLFRCASEDKSKIIRVLNLWQKNNVFAPEVIQPLFDFADPNHPIYHQIQNTSGQETSMSGANGLNSSLQESGTPVLNTQDEGHAIPELNIGKHSTSSSKILDQSTLRQLEHMQQILKHKTGATINVNTKYENKSGFISGSVSSKSNNDFSSYGSGIVGVGFNINNSYAAAINSATAIINNQTDNSQNKLNKKILEYDYGEDGDDRKTGNFLPNVLDSNNLSQLLKDPNVLRQLQTLQQFKKQQEEQQNKLNEMRLQEEAFEKHLQNVLKAQSVGSNLMGLGGPNSSDHNDEEVKFMGADNPNNKIEVINLDAGDSRSPSPTDHDRYKRRRSRSRSRSRGRGAGRRGRNSRSRSPHSHSRSLSPKSSRRRSSRDRDRTSTKDKERDKEREREYERERRKKGIPEAKSEHLSVCTTTLWVGHLSKLVHQEELSDTFGKFGDIVSIDMIYPRGCAFIVMNRRQDAHKAMTNLKNHKLQGRAITISWAAGKGVKSKEWKDYWDLDLGVTFIPWNKLSKNTDLDALEEGGMCDEDTMPNWMKEKINQSKNKDKVISTPAITNPAGIFGGLADGLPKIDTSQPPPTILQSGPPPTLLAPPPTVPMVPPFQMGPPPRLMGPMGVPMPGIPPGMPPNMMAGMPPMMLPGSMLPPPGFGALPQPLDKTGTGGAALQGPPPSFLGNIHMLGLPPQFTQQLEQPPPATSQQPQTQNEQNTPVDDQMDIEMEDDLPNNTPTGVPKTNEASNQIPDFNKPPPLFPNISDLTGLQHIDDIDDHNIDDSRDDEDFGRRHMENIFDKRRNDFGANRGERSRWERGGNGAGRNEGRRGRGDQGSSSDWLENGTSFGDNFQSDLDKKQQNPFFDRRGGNGEFGQDRRNDVGFFPNNMTGNRFGGRGAIQVRGGPQFGPRMGNSFNQRHNSRGGQAPPAQDGLFSNYMERTFEREERNNRSASRNNRRGGGSFDGSHRGGSFGGQQRGNWRDDENASSSRSRDGSNSRLFERRNERGERERDRDRDRERDRDRDRNRDRDWDNRDRRSSSDARNSRNSREQRKSFEKSRDRTPENNERSGSSFSSRRDSLNKESENNSSETKHKDIQDTEEDWDNALEDFDENHKKLQNKKADDLRPPGEDDYMPNEEQKEDNEFAAPRTKEPSISNQQQNSNSNEIFNNTPLYDEPTDSAATNFIENRTENVNEQSNGVKNEDTYEENLILEKNEIEHEDEHSQENQFENEQLQCSVENEVEEHEETSEREQEKEESSVTETSIENSEANS